MAQAATTVGSSPAIAIPVPQVKPTYSLWQLTWKRYMRHRAAVAAAIGLALIFALVFIGPLFISEQQANKVDILNRLSQPTWLDNPPTMEHIMGTDSTGRDIFGRIIYGGQISLIIGFLAVTIALLLGVLFGALSGYYGGKVDSVLMRFTEAMLAIPSLLLLIVISKLLLGQIPTMHIMGRDLSGSVVIVIVVIGITSWMIEAKVVRSVYLSTREQEFITAARALGVKDNRIMWRHILPNSMAPIIVNATLGLAVAIIAEAYVGFLGLGVQEPTASWGNILNQAQSFIQRGVWWLWFFPSVMIILTLLCVNFIGDGLRDALDPRGLVE